MRFLFRESIFGWSMTGLMGKGGEWFIGYSKKPQLPPHNFEEYAAAHKQEFKETKMLAAYVEAVNQIDDHFEYSMESKKDQKKVHQILASLTDKLKAV